MVQFLCFGFLAGYEGPVPTPSSVNHPSANTHCKDVAVYIAKELSEGAMVDLFENPPFMMWCHINQLLTQHKKDSINCRVIMDLSWALPPGYSVNGSTPKDTFLGKSKKMHLPTVHDMASLICHTGRGA